MKEFIEKLIGRLGELKEIEKNRADSCDEEGYGDGEQIYDDGRSQGRFEQSHKIIQIVNELAEEFDGEELRKSQKIYNYIKQEINPYGKPFDGTVYEFGLKVMKYIENLHTEELSEEYINTSTDTSAEQPIWKQQTMNRFERVE